MSKELVVYECALCHVYLDNHTKATEHSKFHIKNNNKRASTKNQDQEDGNLIKRAFPEVTICLERLQTSFQEETKKISNTRKSRAPPPKDPSRLEIKLDTLKAGEIETLIADLYKDASIASSTPESGSSIRRSGRKVKEHFKANYGELDSEDEEVIRTGRARSKNTNKDDDNYSGASSEEEDDGLEGELQSECSESEEHPPNNNNIGTVRRKRSKRVAEDLNRITVQVTGTYWCHVCFKMFGNAKSPYMQHMTAEHLKDGKYTCAYCLKKEPPEEHSYSYIKDFTQHLKLHVQGIIAYEKERPTALYSEPYDNQCKICHKVLKCSDRYAMAKHIKLHEKRQAESEDDPTKIHVCPTCGYRFAHKYRLKRHFLLHLENNPFKCEFLGCGKKFNSEYNLKRHIALHTDRVFHYCKSCPDKFSQQDKLKKHVAEFHSQNSKNKVPIIRKKRFHVQSIHELAPQTSSTEAYKEKEAEDCRFELESVHFADRIVLTDDKTIHIKGEQLSPQRRQTESLSRSQSPTSLSDSEEPKDQGNCTEMNLTTIICSDPLVKKLQETNPEGLKTIIEPIYKNARHNIKGDFKCKICSWTGVTGYTFQRHMKNQHDAAPFDLTSSAPTSENPLALSFNCGGCGYQSQSADELATHIDKAHVGEKKFVCSVCGIRFLTATRRDKHERMVHIEGKQLKCTKCDSRFSYSKALRRHMNVKHNPNVVNTFTCKICSRTLTGKASYARHVKRHTTEKSKVITCQICKQNCSTIHTLRNHIKYVHRGIQNPYRTKQKFLQDQQSKNDKVLSNSNGESTTEEIEKDSTESNPDTAASSENPNALPEVCDDSAEIIGF